MRYLGKPRRVGLLDEIRGLCIILMVLYHAAYDMIYLFGVNIPAFHWPLLRFAQPFVAGIFIFISGIACRYSRSNIKRGAIALALGVGVSAVTLFVMRDQMIYFGILHCLGTSMILFGLLRPLLDKLLPFLGFLIMGLLALLTWNVGNGWVGIPGVFSLSLPAAWNSLPWLLPLGFGGAGADYFPLIPWLFVFLAGAYFGVFFYQGDMPELFYRSRSRFLAAVGRRTIIIYILHQPVVYGILWVVFWMLSAVGIR